MSTSFARNKMPKSTYFRNAILDLIFQGDAIADLAENDTTSPLTNLWVALHTADPGLGGTQASSEASYGGYARQSVSRSAGGFIVTGNTAKLNAQLNFPAVSDATVQTIRFFSIGVASAGSTPILYSGAVTPNIPVSSGFTAPALKADTVVTEL